MTEPDWLSDPDWRTHVRFLGDRVTPRKSRLLAAAFCRLAWHLFDEPVCRAAVEAAERYAEGRAVASELEVWNRKARVIAVQAGERYVFEARHIEGPSSADRGGLADWVTQEVAWAAALTAAGPLDPAGVGQRTRDAVVWSQTGQSGVLVTSATRRGTELEAEHRLLQRAALFDLFDAPFRPVRFDRNWRTADVHAVATHAAEDGDFSVLPILADALEDAGCHDPAVLAHCRGDGPHFRGCWVVDGLLGRS